MQVNRTVIDLKDHQNLSLLATSRLLLARHFYHLSEYWRGRLPNIRDQGVFTRMATFQEVRHALPDPVSAAEQFILVNKDSELDYVDSVSYGLDSYLIGKGRVIAPPSSPLDLSLSPIAPPDPLTEAHVEMHPPSSPVIPLGMLPQSASVISSTPRASVGPSATVQTVQSLSRRKLADMDAEECVDKMVVVDSEVAGHQVSSGLRIKIRCALVLLLLLLSFLMPVFVLTQPRPSALASPNLVLQS